MIYNYKYKKSTRNIKIKNLNLKNYKKHVFRLNKYYSKLKEKEINYIIVLEI